MSTFPRRAASMDAAGGDGPAAWSLARAASFPTARSMQDFQAMPDSMKRLHLQQSLLRVHQQRKKKLRSPERWVWDYRWWFCFFGAMFVWIMVGILFYRCFYHTWTLEQAFYYVVNAGLSIGWCEGTLAETSDTSRAFTIMFIIAGSLLIAAALNMFAAFILDEQRRLTRQYYDVDTVNPEVKEMLKAKRPRWKKSQRALGDGAGGEGGEEEEEAKGKEGSRTPSPALQVEGGKGRGAAARRGLLSCQASLEKVVESVHRTYLNDLPLIHGLIAITVWVTLGVVMATHLYGWSIVRSIYFCISTIATGGLQGLPAERGGWGFVGAYALIGVPVYAYACAMIAGKFLQHQVKERVRRSLDCAVSSEEIELAALLIDGHGGRVGFDMFLVLELLRLGAIDVETIMLIRCKFKDLDTEGQGALQPTDIMTLPRYPSVRRSRDAPVLGGRRSGEGSGSGSLSWIRELFGSGDEPASGEAGDP